MLKSLQGPATVRRGLVVTFYAYKGGTGRSMAVANLAYCLAERHALDVLVVDFDLEAPGLHAFFGIENATLARAHGLLDYLASECARLSKPPASGTAPQAGGSEGERGLENDGVGEPFPQVLTVGRSPKRGSIHFVSAGQQTEEYAANLANIRWEDLWPEDGPELQPEEKGTGSPEPLEDALGPVLYPLRRHWTERADVVLIDGRTGMSEYSAITCALLPDMLFALTIMNRQSMEGLEKVLSWASSHRAESGLEPLPAVVAPSRVPRGMADHEADAWYEKHSDWLVRTAQRTPHVDLTRSHEDLSECEIPFVARHSFEEEECLVTYEGWSSSDAGRSLLLQEKYIQHSRLIAELYLEKNDDLAEGAYLDEIEEAHRLAEQRKDHLAQSRLREWEGRVRIRQAEESLAQGQWEQAERAAEAAIRLLELGAEFDRGTPAEKFVERKDARRVEAQGVLNRAQSKQFAALPSPAARRRSSPPPASDRTHRSYDGHDRTGENLTDSSFHQCSLKKAVLFACKMRHVPFPDANLTEADLRYGNASEANFQRADLTRARLSFADLTGAQLMNARLGVADVLGAKLIGARLEQKWLEPLAALGASLRSEQLMAVWLPAVPATCAAASSNGELIAVGHEDGSVQVIEGRKYRRLTVLRGGGGPVRGIAFGGTRNLFVGHTDGRLLRWDLYTGRRVEEAALPGAEITSLASGGARIAVAFSQPGAKIPYLAWILSSDGARLATLPLERKATALAVSAAGALAAALSDTRVALWDDGWKEIPPVEAQQSPVAALAFLRNDKLLIGVLNGGLYCHTLGAPAAGTSDTTLYEDTNRSSILSILVLQGRAYLGRAADRDGLSTVLTSRPPPWPVFHVEQVPGPVQSIVPCPLDQGFTCSAMSGGKHLVKVDVAKKVEAVKSIQSDQDRDDAVQLFDATRSQVLDIQMPDGTAMDVLHASGIVVRWDLRRGVARLLRRYVDLRLCDQARIVDDAHIAALSRGKVTLVSDGPPQEARPEPPKQASLTVNPDGTLWTVAHDGSVGIWRLEAGVETKIPRKGGFRRDLMSHLVTDSWSGEIVLAESGTESKGGIPTRTASIYRYSGVGALGVAEPSPDPRVTALALKSGSGLTAVAGETGNILVQARSGNTAWRSVGRHDGPVTALVFHPTKPWIIAGGADGSVRIFDHTAVSPEKELAVLLCGAERQDSVAEPPFWWIAVHMAGRRARRGGDAKLAARSFWYADGLGRYDMDGSEGVAAIEDLKLRDDQILLDVQ